MPDWDLEHWMLTGSLLWLLDVPRNALAFMTVALQRWWVKTPVTSLNETRYAVVIPAFNQAEFLIPAVRRLQQQTIPPTQIIVVNDGSTDVTPALMAHLLACGDLSMTIDNPQRLGVSGACNKALLWVQQPRVLFLDCDTYLAADACEHLLRKLDHEGDAVSGNLAIANVNDSLWTGLQQIEYMTGIDMGRTFADRFHAISCMSGAMTLFRTKALQDVGGFDAGSGQDLEITLRLRRKGFRVRFASMAWAYTHAPSTLWGLICQRLRWDRDALRIHMLQYHQLFKANPNEPLGNTLQRYDFLLFTLIPTLLVPAMLFQWAMTEAQQRLEILAWTYGVLMCSSLLSLSWAHLAYRGSMRAWTLLLLPLHPFYQGMLMAVVRLYAFVSETAWRASRYDRFVPERIRKVLYRD